MIQQYFLLAFQIVAHIAAIYALFIFDPMQWLIAFAVYFVTGCLGVSVTYHRYLSHKSWKASQWWIYVGSLCGFWGLVGSPLAWANNHIAHHRFADTERDPHSPKYKPFWKVQWFSMLTTYPSFRFALSNVNPFQTFLHKNYFYIHAGILLALLFFTGLQFTMMVYLVPAAILWNAASLVNTLNHSNFGYRNFELADGSMNNPVTGILAWGEGWHNNHHAKPGNWNFGTKKSEFDISALVIRLLKK